MTNCILNFVSDFMFICKLIDGHILYIGKTDELFEFLENNVRGKWFWESQINQYDSFSNRITPKYVFGSLSFSRKSDMAMVKLAFSDEINYAFEEKSKIKIHPPFVYTTRK